MRTIRYPNATLYRDRQGFWWLYVHILYPGGNYIPSNGPSAVYDSKEKARKGLKTWRVKRKETK